MHKRTFAKEIYKKNYINSRGNGLYFTRRFIDFEPFKFLKTGRKSYCRGCGKIISGDVLKMSRGVTHNYGGRSILTTFSYCLKCSKLLINKEKKKCCERIVFLGNAYKKVSMKDKLYSTKRMKDEELIEQI